LNKSVLYQETKKTQIIQVRWHVMTFANFQTSYHFYG